MKRLECGLDSTLGNYRDIFTILFGENMCDGRPNPALTYLDELIDELGADQEVLLEEDEMFAILMLVMEKPG